MWGKGRGRRMWVSTGAGPATEAGRGLGGGLGGVSPGLGGASGL